jgi:hypothetical protein
LITAEKKIRSVNKHEVFHIRIVSIWEENDTLYRPLDTKNGFTEKQIIVSDRNNSDVDTKIVSDRNTSVSDRNKNNDAQAQDCFYLNDRIRSNNNNLNEEDLYVNADALTPTPFSENENETQSQLSPKTDELSTSDTQASDDIPIVTTTPQTDALIGVATRNTDSLFSDVTQAVVPPEKPAKNTSKRGSKRKQNLEAITPEPLPEKPSVDGPWNVLTCMALADYYRGYTLTNGSYGKALAEAKKLIQRGKTYRQVDATYRYMTGTEKKEDGTGLFDEYWHDKTVDIWHVNTHIDAKLKEIKEKRNPTQAKQIGPTLDQSISATRNLDKEMAEMEARYSRKKA